MIGSYTGTGGHTIVDLKDNKGKLSKHTLKVGDAVVLAPQRQGLDEAFHGILSSISDDELVVVLDDLFVALDKVSTEWKLYKDENKVVYEWMASVLAEMKQFLMNSTPRAYSWPGDTNLIKQLLPPFIKKTAATKPLVRFPNHDVNLNRSQEQAIDNCLSAQASLIYGPPGTGKTQTLVELVKQLSLNGAKVLACGPSNTSVDNLLERLSKCPISSLRVGNTDRFKLQGLQKFSLETKLKEDPIIQTIRSQMDKLRKQINLNDANQETKQLYIELNQQKANLVEEEKMATRKILNQHNVIFSTLSGTGAKLFKELCFDALIIDEATQALEPECWIAISHAKRVVLVGDHHQLPPVVLCRGSSLDNTLFERVFRKLPNIVQMLTTQYRMHQKIINFPSQQLYANKLESHISAKDRLLSDISAGLNDQISQCPLVFINTAGKRLFESQDSKSKINQGEALLATDHLKALLKLGVVQSSIAIISPYAAQINLVRNEVKDKYPEVEIGTVDGFQGREKDAVILSLVRSNARRRIGFLADYRRINVAITRARCHLCIIADKRTVMTSLTSSSQARFLINLGKYLDQHARVLTPAKCRGIYKS